MAAERLAETRISRLYSRVTTGYREIKRTIVADAHAVRARVASEAGLIRGGLQTFLSPDIAMPNGLVIPFRDFGQDKDLLAGASFYSADKGPKGRLIGQPQTTSDLMAKYVIASTAFAEPFPADVFTITPERFEKLLWEAALCSRTDCAEYVTLALNEKIHSNVVEKFLDEALNNMVTPAQVRLKYNIADAYAQLRAELPKSEEPRDDRFSEEVSVWDIAAMYYNWQASPQKALVYAQKGYDYYARSKKGDAYGAPWKSHFAELVGYCYFDIAKVLRHKNGLTDETKAAYRKAREYLLISADFVPKSVNTYHILLEANVYLGLHDENLRTAKQAILAHDGNPPAMLSYGIFRILSQNILSTEHRDRAAVELVIKQFNLVLEQKSKLDPLASESVAQMEHFMGVVYFLAEDYGNALHYIEKKANWETDPQFLYCAALSHFRLGRVEEAKRLAAKIMEIDPKYKKLRDLRREIYPKVEVPKSKGAQKTAAVAPLPEVTSIDPALISEEDFRSAVLGAQGANLTRLFTEDKRVRQFILAEIDKVVGTYASVIKDREGFSDVRDLYFDEPVVFAFDDPEIRSILEILGIVRVSAAKTGTGLELRIELDNERFAGKYYPMAVSDQLLFASGNLREAGELFKGIVLEEIMTMIDGHRSLEVSRALRALPVDEVPVQIDWMELGKQAKALREADEAAHKLQLEQSRLAEEARIAETKRLEPRELERVALEENAQNYKSLIDLLDLHDIDLMRSENITDEQIVRYLAVISQMRTLGAPIDFFEARPKKSDPLRAVADRVRMYGKDAGVNRLSFLCICPETIGSYGFDSQSERSAFLGVYEIELSGEADSKRIVATLSSDGKEFNILGVQKDENSVVQKALHRLILDRLAYKTVSRVVEYFGEGKAPSGVITQRESLLRAIALRLAPELDEESGNTLDSSSLGELTRNSEFLRIATTGLDREPLYVRDKEGRYILVRSDLHDYSRLLARPSSEKYVRVGPGFIRRLPLGRKVAPGERNHKKESPYYYSLKFDLTAVQGGVVLDVYANPSWKPLTGDILFDVSDTKLQSTAVMPYEVSDVLREAYFADSSVMLQSDLKSRLTVYAVMSFDDDSTIVSLPRAIFGSTVEEVMASLRSRPKQVEFLKEFLMGTRDAGVMLAAPSATRKRIANLQVKKRILIIAPSNQGYCQGEFMSHEEFIGKTPALI